MRIIGVMCAALLLGTPLAEAQQTRAETIAAKQAEKAQRLHPYEPTAIERRIAAAQRALVEPPPVYAFIGSVYSGGLLAVGPGFRHRYRGTGLFDVHGAWSLKNFKLVETSVRFPRSPGRRVDFGADARWIDAPTVAHYGFRTTSSGTPARSDYALRRSHVGASARIRLVPFVSVGGRLDAVRYETDGSRLGPGVPAASADPQYAVTSLFAAIDSRQSPGYTNRGSLVRVDWSNFHQRQQSIYAFRRLDAEVNQFLPLLRNNWVIALRALASTTEVDPGRVVPHFLLPDLGGSRMLRGYPSWRFQDRHRMLLTGEYRWTAGHFVDMALFYDTGKVMSEHDFALRGLSRSYGIGVRFHAPTATALRIELAQTAEGPAIVFAFGPSF